MPQYVIYSPSVYTKQWHPIFKKRITEPYKNAIQPFICRWEQSQTYKCMKQPCILFFPMEKELENQ